MPNSKATPCAPKAVALGGLGSFALYANATNPNELAFHDCLVRVNQDLTMVPAAVRNPASAAWLTDVGRASIQGQLRQAFCFHAFLQFAAIFLDAFSLSSTKNND